MLGKDKLENTLLTCHQSNFNQITTLSLNRTLITVVRYTCTITVPPALPMAYSAELKLGSHIYLQIT